MEKIQIGLQLHSVREDFAENPEMTLQKVAEMGYQGVELVYSALTREAEYYTQLLKQTGLACYSVMMDWKELQPGVLEEALEYCKNFEVKSQTQFARELNGLQHEERTGS